MWSRTRNILVGCAVAVAIPIAGTGFAQTESPPAGQPGAEAQTDPQAGTDPQSEEEGLTEGETEELEPVPDSIEITEGSGYRYQAQGRRDPFVSLALGLNVLPPEERPQGLAGMLIQEVSLRGIVKTQDGYIAMIEGTDNKSYFARTGERLYDGNIQEITDTRVVFRQEINDPLRIEQFQRVEKSLYPEEEVQR